MKKVVIVEDDADLLHSLGFLLREEGIKVWKFEKGKPALAKLRKLNPDTVVVDLMLPDINGDKLASVIKNDDELRDIRVVLISADERVAKRATAVRADAYLKKPFSITGLLSLL